MKCYLFDYDGVLVKKHNFAQGVEDSYGLPVDKIYAFFQKYLRPSLCGEGNLLAYLEQERSTLGWPGSAQALFDALYLEKQQFDEPLLDYIKTHLSEQAICCVATNQDRDRLQLIRHEAPIKAVFHKVYASCEFGVAKPDRAYFEHLYTSLQKDFGAVEKSDLLFVDDLEENVASAQSFGIPAYLFTQVERFRLFMQEG